MDKKTVLILGGGPNFLCARSQHIYRLLCLCLCLSFSSLTHAQEFVPIHKQESITPIVPDNKVLKVDSNNGGLSIESGPVLQVPVAQPVVPIGQSRVMRLSGSGSYYLEEIEDRVNHFLPAAEQGDPQAQSTLGRMYLNSEAPEKGVEWYRKAAEQNHVPAMLELGDCYRRGRGVEKDADKAIEWFLQAAEQGNSAGYNIIGDMYDEGGEVPENKVEALKWYHKAAEQGNWLSRYQIGNYYFNGEGGLRQDKAEAVRWYHKAVENNGGWSVVWHKLGTCYFNGEGVPENKAIAVEWFRKAAEVGYWHAEAELGYCYFYGLGIPQDKEEGIKWLQKAANRFHGKAKYLIGMCYLYGDAGFPQDKARAIENLSSAASWRDSTTREAAAALLKEIEEHAQFEREAMLLGAYVPAIIELEIARGATVRSAAFSLDGTKVFTANIWGGNLQIWDAHTGAALKKFEWQTDRLNNYASTMRSCDWSPDGTKIVVADADGTTRIWDVEADKELQKLKGHTDEVFSAAFSPDGKNIVTASKDGTARIWDAESGKDLLTVKHEGGFEGGFVPDAVGALRPVPRRSHTVLSAVFAPDGKQIVTASDDYTVRIWDAESGKEVRKLHHNNGVYRAIFSPDGKKIATSHSGDTTQIWDPETGKILQTFSHPGQGLSIAFSPDGKKLASTSSYHNEFIRIFDVESGEELQKIDKHAGKSVYSVAFSPDGRKIITAGGNGAVLIIDLDQLAEQERQPPLVHP